MQRGQKPKPIRRSSYGIISRTNVPFDEPLSPGLRKSANTQAIGFTTGSFVEQSHDLAPQADVGAQSAGLTSFTPTCS